MAIKARDLLARGDRQVFCHSQGSIATLGRMFGVFRYIVNWTRSLITKADKSVSGKRRSVVDRANGLATLAKADRFRFRNSYASLARGTLQKLVCAK